MLQTPLLVLWGEQSVVHRCFRPLEEWQRVASDARGGALPCGHYIAEEVPDILFQRVMPFLAAGAEGEVARA
jgi:haloacetate dehalogenase